MSDLPKFVQINEEGPREGFQFEKGPISTDRKVELIDALSETGLNHIQVASFVNPNRVPGWADADEVVQRFERKPGIHYTALWLNLKGLQRAMDTESAGHRRLVLADRVADVSGEEPAALDGGQHPAGARNDPDVQAAQHSAEARQHHGGVRLQLRRRDPASTRAGPDAAVARHRSRARGEAAGVLACGYDGLGDAEVDQGAGGQSAGAVSRTDAGIASARHARHGDRECLCRAGDGDLDLRHHGGRAWRLPVRRSQGCRRQCLHRGSGVHAGRDGHRDRHRPGQADRGRPARRGHCRSSAAGFRQDGRKPEGAAAA